MKIVFILCSFLIPILGYLSPLADFPKAEISNGMVNATLLLPDSTGAITRVPALIGQELLKASNTNNTHTSINGLKSMIQNCMMR